MAFSDHFGMAYTIKQDLEAINKLNILLKM